MRCRHVLRSVILQTIMFSFASFIWERRWRVGTSSPTSPSLAPNTSNGSLRPNMSESGICAGSDEITDDLDVRFEHGACDGGR